MERIDKIIGKSLSKRGLGRATQGAMVCFYAKSWGNDLFEPISFSGGLLKVCVHSSCAASDLQIRQTELIDFLNEKSGKQLVKSVRIVLR